MSHYSNSTENASIGAVDREIWMMRKRAERIKSCRQHVKTADDERAKNGGDDRNCRQSLQVELHIVKSLRYR